MFHQRIDRVAADAPPRNAGIEALRGLAAVAVVLCHAATHVNLAFGMPLLARLFRPGHAGVDLFFVLSGFIILLVHRSDVGRPERLKRYAHRRFVRVWPLYWVALAVTIGLRVAGGNAFPALGDLAWSAALLPTGTPILGIAWTLQFEALFYLLFGLLMLDRRLGVVALAGWLAVVVGWNAGPVTSIFGVEFFFGMGVAELVRREGVRWPVVVAGLGGFMFAAAWAAEAAGVLYGYGVAARFAYGLSAAMLVAGVATMRTATVPRPLAVLGSASYSIYLFHLAGIGTVWQVLSRSGVDMPPLAWLVVLAASGVIAGLVVHRFVERPLLARLRR